MTSSFDSTAAGYIPPQRIGLGTIPAADLPLYRRVVSQALDHFGIRDYSIAEFHRHSNITARISRPGRSGLAVRVRTAPAVDARTELTWLLAVRAGTRVPTVAPYADSLEGTTVWIPHPIQGDPLECSLFRWAEGEPLAAHLTPRSYYRLGALTAQMHNFATNWTPPAGLAPLRWDRTIYYEGTHLAVAHAKYAALLSRGDAARVEEVVAAADAELARLAELPHPIFLHGNIEMWNVLVDGAGGLRLLDFEDVMLGQPIHDIAITLYYGIERPDYHDLAAAFRSGYSSIRDWPQVDEPVLNLLKAARATMLINHALLTELDPRPVLERLLPIVLSAL